MKSLIIVILALSGLTACVGKIVGTTVDVAVEAAKVPFKVGGAVVDVVSDDDKEKPNSKVDDASQ